MNLLELHMKSSDITHIKSAISTLFESPEPRRGLADRVYRISVTITPLSLISWLTAFGRTMRFFAANRDHSEQVAAAGKLIIFQRRKKSHPDKVFRQINSFLRQNPDCKLFGGFAFNSAVRPDNDWQGFGTHCFFLPRFELSQTREHTLLSIQILESERGNTNLLQNLLNTVDAWAAPSPIPLPEQTPPNRRRDNPNATQWLAQMRSIHQAMKQQRYNKIILARKSTFSYRAPFPAARLLRAFTQSANTYDYYFELDSGDVFTGRTPELLFHRQGRSLYCEAVAGTIEKGETDATNNANIAELMANKKDRKEHLMVYDAIRDRMQGMCQTALCEPVIKTLPQPSVTHLFAEFTGQLKPAITDSAIFQTLHPTPAVGGNPKRRIIQHIADLEHFQRGWYAAPLGWVSQQDTRFMVGIRSALLKKKNLHVFAGAGIIAESDPVSEWREIENKIKPYLTLLAACNPSLEREKASGKARLQSGLKPQHDLYGVKNMGADPLSLRPSKDV